MTGHEQVDYDDGMHPRPASSQTSHCARSCRPQSGIAPIAAHDHGASDRGLLCQLPGPMDIQMGGSSVKGLDPALELADLRRGWGDAYRRTSSADRPWTPGTPPSCGSSSATSTVHDGGGARWAYAAVGRKVVLQGSADVIS